MDAMDTHKDEREGRIRWLLLNIHIHEENLVGSHMLKSIEIEQSRDWWRNKRYYEEQDKILKALRDELKSI